MTATTEEMEPPRDPMERLIFDALRVAGHDFTTEGQGDQRLDFYVPALRTYIEVKQFNSDRIVAQMASVENVIVAQGRPAVEALAYLIRENFHLARELRDTTNALVVERGAGWGKGRGMSEELKVDEQPLSKWCNLWDLRGRVYLGIPNESRERADEQAAAQTSVAGWMVRTACVKVTCKPLNPDRD